MKYAIATMSGQIRGYLAKSGCWTTTYSDVWLFDTRFHAHLVNDLRGDHDKNWIEEYADEAEFQELAPLQF